ncbi:HupA family protein [Alysiella crassa]|uniref:Transferrin-binding protein B C-lobe/N-lobe beta barrel domain-containing protein n=2 Tax=Alysiella crassa TaxID=153491 RepID=A0A376BMJ7_9NEIS|nr:hypothetical protein [Alysiella crassa]SSY70997.1 Uncharacterised protein [Alysiella crassa]
MNTKVTQITLSVLAALALSACGSSGGDSKPTTGSTASTTPSTTTAPSTNTGGTTAGSTNTGGTTAGSTGTGGTTAGGTGTGGTTAGGTSTDKTDNHQELTSAPATHEHSFVGFKTIVKNESDLITNSSSKTETISDTPEGMQVQNPFPSLDTIVVAEERENGKPKKNGKIVYLEDFDFRGNKGGADATTGKATLNNIYLATAGTKGVTTNGSARTDGTKAGVSVTRTSQGGGNPGTAYVYQDKRQNYTENYKNKVVDEQGGKLLEKADNKASDTSNNQIYHTRDTKGTVAEVYGARTNANDTAYGSTKASDFKQDGKVNAPFQKEELKHVQYGRVTSALNGVKITDLKEGLKLGLTDTLIGSYGEKGNKGTEDNFFYRGVGNTSAQELAKLKADNPNATLTYNGHAVTHGIDSNWYGNNLRVPTAVGGSVGLISGTHVTANVNLGNGNVDGNLFNRWYSSAETENNGVKNVKLVEFNGKLADNGNIAGTATNLTKEVGDKFRSGLFGATLYGANAKEMGGTVASTEKGTGEWLAVFGASRDIEPPKPNTSPIKEKPSNPFGGSNNNGQP